MSTFWYAARCTGICQHCICPHHSFNLAAARCGYGCAAVRGFDVVFYVHAVYGVQLSVYLAAWSSLLGCPWDSAMVAFIAEGWVAVSLYGHAYAPVFGVTRASTGVQLLAVWITMQGQTCCRCAAVCSTKERWCLGNWSTQMKQPGTTQGG